MITWIPQQINFIEKLKEDGSATMFFFAEKAANNYSNYSLDLSNVTE